MGRLGRLEIVLLTYPSIFLIGSLLSPFTSRFSEQVSDNKVVRFINDFFIEKYGYLWFTVTYLSYVFLYTDEMLVIHKKYVNAYLGSFLLNTSVFLGLNHWFLGASIYERIDKALGGHCSLGDSITKIECDRRKGVWESGFDASGHSYLIVSMSIFLWMEVAKQVSVSSNYMSRYSFLPSNDNGDIVSERPKSNILLNVRYVLLSLSLFLLTIWWFMFWVTCLFFHTLLEKMVGMLLGATVPMLVMYLIPY